MNILTNIWIVTAILISAILATIVAAVLVITVIPCVKAVKENLKRS